MDNKIDTYLVIERKISNKKNICFYIFVLLITLLCILFKYNSYLDASGIVIKNSKEYILKLNVPIDSMPNILKTNILIIDKKKYKYKVDNIDNNLYITDNLINYQIIYLKLNIPISYQKENAIIKIKILNETDKIINYFINHLTRKE